jgi:hypothetical protein
MLVSVEIFPKFFLQFFGTMTMKMIRRVRQNGRHVGSRKNFSKKFFEVFGTDLNL